ncbi:MAG: glycosyltransferase [Caulobacter sp.]|nr:glycosyltransferase [Caulobacter sp.]
MTVGYYAQFGWDPVVLCVRPEDADRLVDHNLTETLPKDLTVVSVGAMPERISRYFGVSALGLRAWLSLERAGSIILKKGQFDLVFISTTCFPAMALGRVWKARFGVPFVLDFQDPWATFPPSATPFIRRGAKHRFMHGLHHLLERWTVPAADGLLAVSHAYIQLLHETYPVLLGKPSLASPFGFRTADFAVAQRLGKPLSLDWDNPDTITCLFAGAVPPAMERSLLAVFAAVAAGRALGLGIYCRMRFLFVGTGYARSGNPSVAARLAAQAGISDAVVERPDRVPLLDALRAMQRADVLLVLGSEDDGYTPSKMHQCLSMTKPIIAAAPPNSPVTQALADIGSVLFISPECALDRRYLEDWSERLERLLLNPRFNDYRQRLNQANVYEAATCAARDCALFRCVVEANDGFEAPSGDGAS